MQSESEMQSESATEIQDEKRPKIVVFGAGNVASHLAPALARVARVVQIVSRHKESAAALVAAIGADCKGITSVDDIDPTADFYIIAVKDDAVARVVESTPAFEGIWAHTSGSVPADVFRGQKARYGVFYPLQTFTRSVEVDVSRVPFFIEGSDPATEKSLVNLASKISSRVEIADSSRRSLLHVAAVFACNFANLMWMEADKILRPHGLEVGVMMPLLQATLEKLNSVSPRDAMTGPARRGDLHVIASHLDRLPEDQAEIYRLLSQTILNEFHSDLKI